jgi:hypothetical protein
MKELVVDCIGSISQQWTLGVALCMCESPLAASSSTDNLRQKETGWFNGNETIKTGI